MRRTASPTTSRGLEAFYDVASYFTVNISSPNTPGLRDLQAPAALDELLARVLAARARIAAAGKPRARSSSRSRPTSPRRSWAHRRRARRAAASTASPSSNTTLSRRGLTDRCRARGRRTVGTAAVPPLDRDAGARASGDAAGQIPLIGIGGIDSGADGARQDRGRRDADAALHRADLRGAGLDRAASRTHLPQAVRAPMARGHRRSRRSRCRRHGRQSRSTAETSAPLHGQRSRRLSGDRRGARDLIRREMNQIGTTTMAPSRR